MVAATAGTAAASLVGLTVLAQAPPLPDFEKAARDSHRENSAKLAAFGISMSLEPAFQFRA
jgi:hypothetical protein